MDLTAAVRHYKSNFAASAKRELDSFREEPTLAAAVRRAALAQNPEGKRYGHQRRPLTRDDLRVAEETLSGLLADIEAVPSFAKLMALIEKAVGSRARFGDLYVYDTALRIGAKVGKAPQRVYLHTGTAGGAKALHLDHKAKALDRWDFPPELRELEPHEIEDVLCIYKEYLSGATRELEDARIRRPEEGEEEG